MGGMKGQVRQAPSQEHQGGTEELQRCVNLKFLQALPPRREVDHKI
jgi:hypothetical protein